MTVQFILCSYILPVLKIQKIDSLIYFNQRYYNFISILIITKGNKQTKQPTNQIELTDQPEAPNLYTLPGTARKHVWVLLSFTPVINKAYPVDG